MRANVEERLTRILAVDRFLRRAARLKVLRSKLWARLSSLSSGDLPECARVATVDREREVTRGIAGALKSARRVFYDF